MDAVLSGIADVRRAIPETSELTEASPDFVGLTDVAELLHVSRQNVRKLIVDCEALAPAPVHEGRPTIWRLARVLDWLREQKSYAVDEDLMALARTNMQVNLAIDQKDADDSSQTRDTRSACVTLSRSRDLDGRVPRLRFGRYAAGVAGRFRARHPPRETPVSLP